MDRNSIILKKMLEEIEYLEGYIKDFDFDVFMQAEDKKRVVAMTLINIGELVRHLTKDFRKAAADLPFDDAIGLRDIAAHGYKSLKFERIWNTVKIDIPDIKTKIEKLLLSSK